MNLASYRFLKRTWASSLFVLGKGATVALERKRFTAVYGLVMSFTERKKKEKFCNGALKDKKGFIGLVQDKIQNTR